MQNTLKVQNNAHESFRQTLVMGKKPVLGVYQWLLVTITKWNCQDSVECHLLENKEWERAVAFKPCFEVSTWEALGAPMVLLMKAVAGNSEIQIEYRLLYQHMCISFSPTHLYNSGDFPLVLSSLASWSFPFI